MKITPKALVTISTIFFIFILFSGCKEKGCTDPSAINYNSVADEDDGTCIICHGTTDTISNRTCDLIDNNFSSPRFGDVVGVFYLTQTQDKYPYTECGTNKCHIQVNFQSLVDSEMVFTFNLQHSSSSSNVSFSWSKSIVVPRLQNLNLGSVPDASVFNPCNPLIQNNIFCSSFNSIIYQ